MRETLQKHLKCLVQGIDGLIDKYLKEIKIINDLLKTNLANETIIDKLKDRKKELINLIGDKCDINKQLEQLQREEDNLLDEYLYLEGFEESSDEKLGLCE